MYNMNFFSCCVYLNWCCRQDSNLRWLLHVGLKVRYIRPLCERQHLKLAPGVGIEPTHKDLEFSSPALEHYQV